MTINLKLELDRTQTATCVKYEDISANEAKLTINVKSIQGWHIDDGSRLTNIAGSEDKISNSNNLGTNFDIKNITTVEIILEKSSTEILRRLIYLREKLSDYVAVGEVKEDKKWKLMLKGINYDYTKGLNIDESSRTIILENRRFSL